MAPRRTHVLHAGANFGGGRNKKQCRGTGVAAVGRARAVCFSFVCGFCRFGWRVSGAGGRRAWLGGAAGGREEPKCCVRHAATAVPVARRHAHIYSSAVATTRPPPRGRSSMRSRAAGLVRRAARPGLRRATSKHGLHTHVNVAIGVCGIMLLLVPKVRGVMSTQGVAPPPPVSDDLLSTAHRTPSNRPAAEVSRARQRRPRAPARIPSPSLQHRPTPTRFRVPRRCSHRRRLITTPRARAARGRPARRPAATLIHDRVLALHLRAQAAQQPTSEPTTPPPLPAAPLRVCPQPNG